MLILVLDYINQCKEPYDQLLTGSATVFVPSTDDWQPGSNPVDAADKHSEGCFLLLGLC